MMVDQALLQILATLEKISKFKISQPFTKRQILDSYKLKEFAEDNFKFDETGGKCSKWVENNFEQVCL